MYANTATPTKPAISTARLEFFWALLSVYCARSIHRGLLTIALQRLRHRACLCVIHEIYGYPGQAAVRRHFIGFASNCQHALAVQLFFYEIKQLHQSLSQFHFLQWRCYFLVCIVLQLNRQASHGLLLNGSWGRTCRLCQL